MATDLEVFALGYWSGVQRFRVMSRLGADTSDVSDDLEVVAMHSPNAIISRRINVLLGGEPAAAKDTAG